MTDWDAKHREMQAAAALKWDAIHKVDGLAALKKFEAAARKLQKLFAKVAKGEIEERVTFAPFERLQSMRNKAEIRGYEPGLTAADAWIDRLRVERRVAFAAGETAREVARARESRALSERVYEDRREQERRNPGLAAYQRELLLDRIRQGKA